MKVFDTDGSGTVSFDEFKRVFSQYDFSDVKDQAGIVLSNNLGKIITDLREIIKANNLNLMDIFSNFDGDKEGNLDIQEFTRLIKVIAPGIK